jgi:hypothetical protein
MIESLLNVGRLFDWLTPLFALSQDYYYGSEVDFTIPAGAGWSRSEIKRLLNRHGVQVWGLLYSLDGEELMFSVKKEQAEYAYYLLQNAGEPELYVPDEFLTQRWR